MRSVPGQIFARVKSGDVCLLWRSTATTSPEEFESWHAHLSADEQVRAATFRYDTDRIDYVAAHALLRQALGMLVGCPPSEVGISSASNGKPCVAPRTGADCLRINLSHTCGLVMVAVAHEIEVGVDVENTGRKVVPEVAALLCSADEASEIAQLSNAEQSRAYTQLWTIKEALVKASGQGLAVRINDICCAGKPPRLRRTGPLPGRPEDWSFECGELSGSYLWAAAAQARRVRFSLWRAGSL